MTVNGPSSSGSCAVDLHRLLAPAVQAHEAHERGRPVRGAAVARAQRRHVDGVIEVRVADEHAHDVPHRGQPAVDRRGVRERGAAAQERPQRHARDVRVEVDRLPLERQAVAGHTQPFELQATRQLERARGAGRELRERRGVRLRALLVLRDEAPEAGEMTDESPHEQRSLARGGRPRTPPRAACALM